MAHEVFISYSSKDKQMANAICHYLEQEKISCWIAPRDVGLGMNFADEIVNAIPKSKIMIIIFSANSNSSKQVMRELELAVNNDIIVIPVRIEDIIPTGGMSFYLATMQWIDIIDKNMDRNLSLLTDKIKNFLGIIEEEKTQNKKGEKAQKQVKPINKKLIITISSFVLLFAIGVTLFLLRDNIFNDKNSLLETTQEGSHTISPGSETSTTKPAASVPTDKPIPPYTPEDFGWDPNMNVEFNDPILMDCIAQVLIDLGIDFEDKGFALSNIFRIETLFITTAHAEEESGYSDMENYLIDNGYHYTKYITDGSVVNLEGMQYAKNLKCLIITEQALSDISALDQLDQLEVIYLLGDNVSDIDALYNKPNLKYVNLTGNPIQNVGPLEHAQENLEHLVINDCKNIDNINVVSVLRNLKVLAMINVKIEDISLLIDLELKELYIDQDVYDKNIITVEILVSNGCNVFTT